MNFSGKGYKKWMAVILIVAILPFLIMSFYNRPSADDLILNYEAGHYGISRIWTYFYGNLSSRYFSVFIILLLVSGRFILDHYFLVPLIMFSSFYFSSWFLMSQVNRYFFGNEFKKAQLPFLALAFLILFLTIAPEIATGFYWLSGCFTHMLPITLLFFFTGFHLKAHFSDRSLIYFILSWIFLVAALGCSEMISIYITLMLLVELIVLVRIRNNKWRMVLLTFLIALVSDYFLVFAKGELTRIGVSQGHNSILYALGGSLLKYWMVLASIFSTPFFWLCIITVFFSSSRLPRQPVINFSIWWWLPYFTLIGFVFFFFVYLYIPSDVPARATNPVAIILVISIIVFVYHLSCYYNPRLNWNENPMLRAVYLAAFVTTLFCNKNFFMVMKDQVAGPVYSSIYDARVRAISESIRNGSNKIVLKNYKEAWDQYTKERIHEGLVHPFQKLIDPYPRTIFFNDDLSSDWIYSYAEYYKIDSIQVNGKSTPRFSLDPEAKNLELQIKKATAR